MLDIRFIRENPMAVKENIKKKFQEEKLPLSPQELRERVGAALGELQDFRSRECAGMVEALLRCALPQDAEDSLREIQGQLKLYEDDNAEALLGGLLSRLEKEEG